MLSILSPISLSLDQLNSNLNFKIQSCNIQVSLYFRDIMLSTKINPPLLLLLLIIIIIIIIIIICMENYGKTSFQECNFLQDSRLELVSSLHRKQICYAMTSQHVRTRKLQKSSCTKFKIFTLTANVNYPLNQSSLQ